MRRCTHTSAGKTKKMVKKLKEETKKPPIVIEDEGQVFDVTWLNPDQGQLPLFVTERTKAS